MFAYVSDEYVRALSRKRIDVPLAALHFAKNIAYPDLDIKSTLDEITVLATAFKSIHGLQETELEEAKALAHWLFHDKGFRGNSANYTDPQNSYLNMVLAKGLGLPITLSVLYVAVATQLGLTTHGVGLPGHFIVGVRTDREIHFLDPFNGGVELTKQACIKLVRNTVGFTGVFNDEWLLPSTPRNTLTRMLTNLRNIYIKNETWDKAVAAIEHMCVIQPEEATFWRDLGIVWNRNGDAKRGIYCMEAYLLRTINPPDRVQVQDRINTLVEELSKQN